MRPGGRRGWLTVECALNEAPHVERHRRVVRRDGLDGEVSQPVRRRRSVIRLPLDHDRLKRSVPQTLWLAIGGGCGGRCRQPCGAAQGARWRADYTTCVAVGQAPPPGGGGCPSRPATLPPRGRQGPSLSLRNAGAAVSATIASSAARDAGQRRSARRCPFLRHPRPTRARRTARLLARPLPAQWCFTRDP